MYMVYIPFKKQMSLKVPAASDLNFCLRGIKTFQAYIQQLDRSKIINTIKEEKGL